MGAVDKGVVYAMELLLAISQAIGADSYIGTDTGNLLPRTAAGSNVESRIPLDGLVPRNLYLFDRGNRRSRSIQRPQKTLLLGMSSLQNDQNAIVAVIDISSQTHFGSQTIYTGTETHALYKALDMYVILIHL